MNAIPWWGYVILAGLSWGTYVPIIFYGGTELTTKPGTIGGRLASILCVGIAYFIMAVVIPVVLMATRGEEAKPEWKLNGLLFSGLAGVAGAVGAICVIFASKAATDAAKEEFDDRVAAITARMQEGQPPESIEEAKAELQEWNAGRARYMASYRVYIAPLIFCLAPLINTLLSLVWHPKPGEPWHFHLETPSWKLLVGIVFVAIGTFLVLKSKEDLEASKAGPKPAPSSAPATTGS